MNKWILIAAGAGFIAYNRANSFIKALQSSTIKVVGGKFVELPGEQETSIIVRFQVTNPTNTTFTVGFKGSLNYQGNTIGIINYYGADKIRPGINIIDVPATINNVTTVDSVVQLFKQLLQGNYQQSVELNGALVKLGFKHPVNETFTIKDFL